MMAVSMQETEAPEDLVAAAAHQMELHLQQVEQQPRGKEMQVAMVQVGMVLTDGVEEVAVEPLRLVLTQMVMQEVMAAMVQYQVFLDPV
jgi:hydroxymethylpyrimidine/phosphomethylpyrimidine kinase